MKRLLILILVIVLVLSFVGCSKIPALENNSDLVLVSHGKIEDTYNHGFYKIFYHKETKVMYLFHRDGNGAGLTVMVDEDGKPLLYEVEE